MVDLEIIVDADVGLSSIVVKGYGRCPFAHPRRYNYSPLVLERSQRTQLNCRMFG